MKNRKQSSSNLPASVEAMRHIPITGNIVPPQWFKTITFDNGKPDTNSILILSDIVYWYRPTEIRDERSGAVIGQKKKFAEDLLRKSYADLQKQFGLSDRQLRDCFSRLEKRGVIRRVFRILDSAAGRQNNVMYIELLPSILKTLMCENNSKAFTSMDSDPINMDSDPCPVITGQGVTSNEIPITIERDTYPVITRGHIETNTSSEITPNISLSRSGGSSENTEPSSSKEERENDSISGKMLSIWNQLIPEKSISSANKFLSRQLEVALRDQLEGDFLKWKTVCENFKSSNFLMGEADKVTFKPDISWLVDPEAPRVAYVLSKSKWIFGDRISSSKTKINEKEVLEVIEGLPEDSVAKEVRVFVFKTNPAFYQSYFKKASLNVVDKKVLLVASSPFARDQIDQEFSGKVGPFLKQNHGMDFNVEHI